MTQIDGQGGLLNLEFPGDRETLIYARPGDTPAEVHDPELPGRRHRAELSTSWRPVAWKIQRYEGFEQDERGIARNAGPLIAWFKDLVFHVFVGDPGVAN